MGTKETIDKIVKEDLGMYGDIPKSYIVDYLRKAIKITQDEVRHKHLVSMQCSKDAMKESCIDVLKRNKTLSHKLKQNLIKKMRCGI